MMMHNINDFPCEVAEDERWWICYACQFIISSICTSFRRMHVVRRPPHRIRRVRYGNVLKYLYCISMNYER